MAVTLSHPARRLERQSIADVVNWVRAQLGLTRDQFGALVGATGRSVQRWADVDDPTMPVGEHRDKVDQFGELRRLLEHQFPSDPNAALEWLYTAVPLLEGRRPIDLIRQKRLDRVIAVLAGSYAGAFA